MKNITSLTVYCALAIVAIASPLAEAGRAGGPGTQVDRVQARGTVVYEERFWGGELAQVLVEGDGDTDLDLYIYDEYGNLVASDTDYTDVCLGQWYPPRTGYYRIEVRNLGSVYNEFSIVTN